MMTKYWKPSIEILMAAAESLIFYSVCYSIQHPNKIVNTICPAVGKFTKDLSFFSVKILDTND